MASESESFWNPEGDSTEGWDKSVPFAGGFANLEFLFEAQVL